MKLKRRLQNGKTYIIAEMSANHAQDLSIALKMVEEAKTAGADCLKTQTYTADTLTIKCERKDFLIDEGLWKGKTLHDLYNSAHMPWEWNIEILKKCKEVGIDFLSTAFDKTSVDFLVDLGVEAIKIASFEMVDIPLIKYAASKGKTMILSCGMCTKDEICQSIQACHSVGNTDIILMKCSSEYPAEPKNLNLQTIIDMKSRFQYPIGFSDHSLGSVSSIVAVGLGAVVLEKHFCLDKKISTADVAFSMDPREFSEFVADIRIAEQTVGKTYYGISEKEKESLVFRRSLYAVKEIKPGDVFSEKNVRSIRPGYGISPAYQEMLIGKSAKRMISAGEAIAWDDIKD